VLDRDFKPFLNPQKLVDWLEENDILMNLTKADSETLMNYMEGHGYQLGVLDGDLARVDNCAGDIPDHDKISIDEIIDTVCEWNYEMIQYAKEKKENPKDFLDFANTSNYLDSLRKDEKQLDVMFNQTCFGKEVEALAQKLAKEAIKSMKAARAEQEKDEEMEIEDTDKEKNESQPNLLRKVR